MEVRPTPSDNSRTSLPFNPQPTAHSRSACVSDMSYTGAPAKGWETRGGGRTKKNRETPFGLHSCNQTSVSRCDLNTASSISGCGCTDVSNDTGSFSSSSSFSRCLLTAPPLALPLIFTDSVLRCVAREMVFPRYELRSKFIRATRERKASG